MGLPVGPLGASQSACTMACIGSRQHGLTGSLVAFRGAMSRGGRGCLYCFVFFSFKFLPSPKLSLGTGAMDRTVCAADTSYHCSRSTRKSDWLRVDLQGCLVSVTLSRDQLRIIKARTGAFKAVRRPS